MKKLSQILLAFLILATCHCVMLAQSQGPLLLENPTISRTKIAFSYAGDIWLVDRSGGTAQRLTTDPAREAYPTFSPDGSQVAFTRFNPSTGPSGWDVFVVSVFGGEARRVTYHPDADFPVNWTSDGERILIFSLRHRTSSLDGRLYTIPVQGGFATEVPVPRGWRGSFSPTGDRIAYTPHPKMSEITSWRNYRGGATSRIWLVKLSDASNEEIPRGNFNDSDPMWIGDKVYFVSDRAGTENLFSYDTVRKTIAQLTHFEKYGVKSASTNRESIVFNQGGAIHIFNPQTNKSTRIDVRVSGEFPELAPRKIDPESWGLAGLSPDATHLLMGMRGEIFTGNTSTGEVTNITKTGRAVVWSRVSTDTPPKPEDGRFKINPVELTIEPREEWKQMFGEASRRYRENFYDPNLHGQNLAELQAHYAAYLPNISTREDLNKLLNEMFSHLSTSHLIVAGGDVSFPQGGFDETVGLLGADLEIDSGRYRIKRILRGDNSRQIYSPFALPGVNVKVGEYILAVDGADISADQSFYRYFLNKASNAVSLKVATTADGKDARTVRVIPLPNEANLRNYDWIEGNRLRVAELSGGKLGYLYLPDTGEAGYNVFNREFYAQLDKQGLIVDGRFNSGGRAADYIIDTLRRVPLQHAQLRDAEDIRIPTGIINGPKVLLTNERAGSGADTLPWMWQQTKIGPVVGTRTGGHGIGGSPYNLIDGGSYLVPDWGWYDPRTGTWLLENRGVTPDYELEIMPPAWRAGRDPQLEKAVELAMDALKKTKPLPSKRPTYPVYK